jgi:hypothetical protein
VLFLNLAIQAGPILAVLRDLYGMRVKKAKRILTNTLPGDIMLYQSYHIDSAS